MKNVDSVVARALALICWSVVACNLWAETVVTLDQRALRPSLAEIEDEASLIVEVLVEATYDDYQTMWPDPTPLPGVDMEKYQKWVEQWRSSLPHVVSGPKNKSVSETMSDGVTRVFTSDLAGSFVRHEVIIISVLKGARDTVGKRVFVNQPGSIADEVSAQGMPLMIPGQHYQLYLKETPQHDRGLRVYDISGLNGGLMRKHGDEIYHELGNTTVIEGRKDRE